MALFGLGGYGAGYGGGYGAGVGYGPGVAGAFGNTSTILVLFILLVIILRVFCF